MKFPYYPRDPNNKSNTRTACFRANRITLLDGWVNELGLNVYETIRVLGEYDSEKRILSVEFWENGDQGIKLEHTPYRKKNMARFCVNRFFKGSGIDLSRTNTYCGTQWDEESQKLNIFLPEDKILYSEPTKAKPVIAEPPQKKITRFEKRKITL